EGWTDKEVLRKYLESHSPTTHQSVGLCHAKGVKRIKDISSLLELAGRKIKVLSDSDQAAVGARNRDGEGLVWRTYSEVAGREVETLEDLLEPAALASCYEKIRTELQAPEIPPDWSNLA